MTWPSGNLDAQPRAQLAEIQKIITRITCNRSKNFNVTFSNMTRTQWLLTAIEARNWDDVAMHIRAAPHICEVADTKGRLPVHRCVRRSHFAKK